MLSRKSRKIRISEPTTSDMPTNNILIELTTPANDGTIPLLNFLENTERFLGDNANMLTRVYDLEREVSIYKEVFRQYDEYLENISCILKDIVENDDCLRGNVPMCIKQPLLPTIQMRSIRHYFKPLVSKNVENKVSETIPCMESESKMNMEIDQQLNANIQKMEGLLKRVKNRNITVNADIHNKKVFRQSSEQVSTTM